MADVLLNETQRLEVNDKDVLKPYEDPAYPIKLFMKGIEENYRKAEEASLSIYRELSIATPELAKGIKEEKDNVRYVLDISDELRDDIEAGRVKLTVENGGKTYAQIRDKNGYGRKIPVKREVFEEEIDPLQLANAMQLKAIQEQVEEMAEQVIAIDLNVKDVLQGQQNDRIGLLQSGLSLYLEATCVQNLVLHNQLVSQALNSLSEATFRLSAEMKSDILFLVNREYQASKKNQVHLIDQRMAKIEQSFAYIYQASILRAAIYLSEGETQAMAQVLERYSAFIDDTVSRNVSTLIECDRNDKGEETGTWRTRAKLKLDVSGIQKQLRANQKIFYLTPKSEVAV